MHFDSAQCRQKGFATFMSTERGFALPLVLAPLLLISLLAATVYYYYQSKPNISQNNPTPQPSAQIQVKNEVEDWKIYTDTKYGFLLKYPSDLIPEERTETSMLSVGKKVDAVSFVGKSFSFYMTFHPNPNNLTISDWLSEQRQFEKENCEIDCLGFSNASEGVTVAGQKALQQELSSVIGSTNIYMPLKNGFVAWVGSTHGSNPSAPLSTRVMLSKILSTFKFLDDETANWKIYTNEPFAYTVKIPPLWVHSETPNKESVTFNPPDAQYGTIIFKTQRNNKNISVLEWSKSMYSDDVIREEKMINNYQTIFIQDDDKSIPSIRYLFSNNSNLYELGVSTKKGEDVKIFNKILQTFRFLK